jgi:hypothetical protein
MLGEDKEDRQYLARNKDTESDSYNRWIVDRPEAVRYRDEGERVHIWTQLWSNYPKRKHTAFFPQYGTNTFWMCWSYH